MAGDESPTRKRYQFDSTEGTENILAYLEKVTDAPTRQQILKNGLYAYSYLVEKIREGITEGGDSITLDIDMVGVICRVYREKLTE